ncbi:hypothetical protein PRZ48_000204 [Zasmidium cellare]|uniref:Uncharacterized protein n=1 Tax=Zasmidium cellare TaxID=395010 RepID=A0ABR0EXW0_ZASCE|nr:hypothetical protein PRZ48_000204 [Zasmidium cellare]
MAAPTKRNRTGSHLEFSDQPKHKSQKLARQMPDEKDSQTDGQTATAIASDSKHFRFLCLAAELRNEIYSLVLQDYPIAQIARYSGIDNRPGLRTSCPLFYASRQIHKEMKSMLVAEATSIAATVHDFDFGHIITYFDNVSNLDFKALNQGNTSDSVSITLNLSFTNPNAIWMTMDEWDGYVMWTHWVRETAEGVAVDVSYRAKCLAHLDTASSGYRHAIFNLEREEEGKKEKREQR